MLQIRDEIVLAVDGESWTAAFLRSGAPAPETVRLFGTHILPTAFLARARPDVVKREIQALNPDCTVRVLEGGAV